MQFNDEILKFVREHIFFAISIMKFIKFLSLNTIDIKTIEVQQNKCTNLIQHKFNTFKLYVKIMINISFFT